jgi:hypothetical protein
VRRARVREGARWSGTREGWRLRRGGAGAWARRRRKPWGGANSAGTHVRAMERQGKAGAHGSGNGVEKEKLRNSTWAVRAGAVRQESWLSRTTTCRHACADAGPAARSDGTGAELRARGAVARRLSVDLHEESNGAAREGRRRLLRRKSRTKSGGTTNCSWRTEVAWRRR